METLFFAIVSFMIAMYVVFDGFDLGAGVVHLAAARTEAERRTVLASIGPVWDGNEVWLLAGGGLLFLAFPPVYASAFSGFYLPLMIVLWLLILRGIAIEFRNQFDAAVWRQLWDVVFACSSALLAVFYGAALGNVVRGVPLDADGVFFLPLWTNFLPGENPGVLDWYTTLVGVTALVALAGHGALWTVWRTEGELRERSRRVFRIAWGGTVALTALTTIATFQIQPHVPEQLFARPWGLIFPALAVAGLAGMFVFDRRGDELRAFIASCAYIVGMLTACVFGLYPYLLPSNIAPGSGLDAFNSSVDAGALTIAATWFIPGLLLITAYFTHTYRSLGGKVRPDDYGH